MPKRKPSAIPTILLELGCEPATIVWAKRFVRFKWRNGHRDQAIWSDLWLQFTNGLVLFYIIDKVLTHINPSLERIEQVTGDHVLALVKTVEKDSTPTTRDALADALRGLYRRPSLGHLKIAAKNYQREINQP
ncbi:hypothetical protein LCGC14_1648700 [marine sediment metagenome]|uniref:Uncharacterized protein n=1 Tax=marine sediment metagenome TaxID=412755 RepID=A0A0F9IK10_9ZZZZ